MRIRFHRCSPLHKAKPAGAQEVLERLNSYLDAAHPEPVKWLTRLWDDQQKAVTYKELREAILVGGMDEAVLQVWQEDYAVYVNEHMKDAWLAAMQEGAAKFTAKHPDFFFNPMSEGIQAWTGEHAAQWVTMVSSEQRSALAALIGRGASGKYTVGELSRAIRPLVGLTERQALANLHYYERIRDSLLSSSPGMKRATAEKRAREAALKYAARQHRERAYTIATTEMAFAYNKGADEGVKQAIEQGYMGNTVRVWITAGNEGVCPVCGSLDGVEIEMEQAFSFPGKSLYDGQKETPPAHPRCRCAVEYWEVEPPAWRAGQDGLQPNQGTNIMEIGMSSGKAGDTNGYTVITKVEPFDFSNHDALQQALDRFIALYGDADVEHALVLSPLDQAFHLTGTSTSVDTRLVGKDALKDSVDIHNHPPRADGFADSFSRQDFRELIWGQTARSLLVAGGHTYSMSYSGAPITPEEAEMLYKGAFDRILERAFETGIPVEAEQLEIMRELARSLEGLSFHEF